jgi:hypothetical protein
MRQLLLRACAACLLALAPAAGRGGEILFSDDFEGSLDGWRVSDPSAIRTLDSGDPVHGRVLEMAPRDAQIDALMRGSEAWRAYRVEGEVLFPTDEHNYLGIIYNYRERDGRADFGSLYLKGNSSYIRMNPRRDWNPSRMLYEELKVPLRGPDHIEAGRWYPFAFEVQGHACHFYVGDLKTPRVTFDLFEGDSGAVGFKPRVVGGPVWLDNVRVMSLDRLSYAGPSLPRVEYDLSGVVTRWRVLGPLSRAHLDVERLEDPGQAAVTERSKRHEWRPAPVDARGAVVTGQVVDFLGPGTVAYLLATLEVPDGARRRIVFSSIDDLALWDDGEFLGYAYRDTFAWHDVGHNPDHPPTDWIDLDAGVHHVLVRVRGGVYASGGFFARLIDAPDE